MDSLVDSDGIPVVVPSGMAGHSNSVEFTHSQQSVEGMGQLGQRWMSSLTVSMRME